MIKDGRLTLSFLELQVVVRIFAISLVFHILTLLFVVVTPLHIVCKDHDILTRDLLIVGKYRYNAIMA